MALTINTNTAAIGAAGNLNKSNEMLQKSLARLSSGSKIVNSSDDAGGLAVSMRMQAAIKRTDATSANVANANILKPDVAAPGTDILAGVTADLTRDERNAVAAGGVAPTNWAFYTGTSMASPHIAGIAALLKQKYPTWTPAAIKSAMMTTSLILVGQCRSCWRAPTP